MVELKLKQATIEVERLGELFLINRDRMIATDKQRNSTREALAALRKLHGEETAWIQDSSNSISRYGTIAAGAVLEAEAARLESMMSALRAEQKRLISLMHDKGATPDSLDDGLLHAMLQLKG